MKTALVVDDSKSARFALRRYLEGHQYQVEAVESAAEAMSFLVAHRPQVIFLDHVMPTVDGFEALRSMKADIRLKDIPIVICSSSEGPEFNAMARAAGASSVLQKPPHPDQLARVLKALVTPSAIVVASASPAALSESAALQAVAKPLAAPGVAPAAAALQAPPTAEASSDTVATVSRPDDSLVRAQLEARLKKVSQGLAVQFAEIKTTVGHIANQQVQLAEAPGNLRSEFRVGLEETHQALRQVSSRIDSLEREIFRELDSMRTHMETLIKSQAERVNEIAQSTRQTAAEEAKVVAERTVMSAAMRISDQLSDVILGAVGRR